MALIKGLRKAEKYLLTVLSSAMVLVVFFQIINREILKLNVIWPEELARYLMIWLVYIAGVVAFKRGAHIGIDVITSRVHGKTARYMEIFQNLVTLVFLGIITYFAIPLIQTQLEYEQLTPALEINIAWVYAAAPVWGFLSSIEIVIRLIGVIKPPKEFQEEK